VTRAIFNGHEALTFSDYTDLATGMTLRAEPGQVYDIAPASGRVVPEFPEPWFTRVIHPTSGVWIGVSRELTEQGAEETETDPAPDEPEHVPEAAEESAPEVSE